MRVKKTDDPRDSQLYSSLIMTIRKRIPERTRLASTLMSILSIEKEAVYRRLRGEVPFSFPEIANISRELGISIDELVGDEKTGSRPFSLRMINYANPADHDYDSLKESVELLGRLKEEGYSEITVASNVLPAFLYLKYENLSRFFMFKWLYLSGQKDVLEQFHSFTQDQQLTKIQAQLRKEFLSAKSICMIWDHLLFRYLINDIRYFHSIKALGSDSIEIIKTELLDFIDEIENIAARGRIGKECRVHIYISNINFDSTYIMMEGSGLNISIIQAFTLDQVSSLDNRSYEKVRRWTQSLKRLSTLISETGEMQRVQFMEEQRELVNSL